MTCKTKMMAALAPFVATSWLAAPCGAQIPEVDQILKRKPALASFAPQQPKRVTLANGMQILLQEDHELPLIQGYALIHGGSREEPADKVGLVDVFGDAWRTGGTKLRTGDALDDYLEARAAKVETWGGFDSSGISWDCLKDNFTDVLGVVVELLQTEPAFPQDKIDLAKTQMNTSIARRNDDADAIVRREARRLAYGPTSPYGRIAEYAGVAAITRDDLARWHKSYVVPNNVVMAVWGDFDAAQMQARLQRAFGAWPKGAPAGKAQAAFAGPKPGVYFIPKDDVTQSKVRMVHLGTTRDTPDFYAIEVLNELFGGSFSSRLVTNVRTKKGLAYAVGGSVGMQYDYPGLVSLGLGTKSESTLKGIDALMEEVDSIEKEAPAPEELARAKDSILNSFVFRLDSKAKILHEKVSDLFHGYPLDLLERYQAGIARVTADDVLRVARQYIHKDKLAILVVGKASDFDRPLASLGSVTPIDITIPTAAAGAAPKPSASTPEARALFAKAIASHGSAAQIKAISTLRLKGTLMARSPQGELPLRFEVLRALPDRLRQNVTTPMGEMSVVVTPKDAFMIMGPNVQAMPPSQRDSALADLKRDSLTLAAHVDDPAYAVTAAGNEKVGEVETQVLRITGDGVDITWYVDPTSGRILRSRAPTLGPAGPTEEVVEYSDFRTVSGLTMPFHLVFTQGQPGISGLTIEELVVNPPLEPASFERPAAPAQAQ
jgi:zinc protease